jgi:hypothetical protein
MDADTLSETLETLSDAPTARARQRDVHTLRGIRGVPNGEIAQVSTAAWQDDPPRLPGDEAALHRLFTTAFEDGLVAIGLLAALLPDDPRAAGDVALDWLPLIDDIATADALGWLVLGPAVLTGACTVEELIDAAKASDRAAVRRAALMAGLAMTPTPLEGPAAAPLRARSGQRVVQFVDAPATAPLHALAHAFLRDEAPAVRKALRRVLVAWAEDDPDGASAWMGSVRGGLPKMIREALEKAVRKGRRRAAE